jgi:hypothetical protein
MLGEMFFVDAVIAERRGAWPGSVIVDRAGNRGPALRARRDQGGGGGIVVIDGPTRRPLTWLASVASAVFSAASVSVAAARPSTTSPRIVGGRRDLAGSIGLDIGPDTVRRVAIACVARGRSR